MQKWAKVTDCGIVDIGTLPKQHRANGRLYTSLHKLPTQTLNSWGFYPYEDNPPPFDERYQYLGSSTSFDGTAVTKTYTVINIDLETFKERKKDELAAARWEEMSAPTMVDGYDSLWYAVKEAMNDMLRASLDLQTAIALGHLPEGTTLDWKTADGNFVTVSLGDLVTVRLLLSQRQQALYSKEASLLNLVEAAETVEDLEGIVWSMELSS